MVGIARSQILKAPVRKVLFVSLVVGIVISGFIVVDIVTAGYEYTVTEASFAHNIPETVYCHSDRGGVTYNPFSLSLEIPANHSVHHHITPREISLLFWFKDDSDANLSAFIVDVLEVSLNSTCSIFNKNYDRVNRVEDGWWAPSRHWFAFNERTDMDHLGFGCSFELPLVNCYSNDFDGHELNVRLDLSVTYSRWWFNQRISQFHQTIKYSFSLPDDGTVLVRSR